MTPLQNLYDAFLRGMTDDEYQYWTEEEVNRDILSFLKPAILKFKFPRKGLKIEGDNFIEDDLDEEIEILAAFMRCDWLNRVILSWENIRPQYSERDFSPSKLLDSFRELLIEQRKEARRLESIYYRSVNKRPYDYTKLAGGKNE